MSEDEIQKEAEALSWLTANRWSEEVIESVGSSSLGHRRLFPSHRRMLADAVPRRPANEVAFESIDLLMTMVEGGARLARRVAGQVLDVAVPPRRPAAPGPEPTGDSISAFPLRMVVDKGDSRATSSFVVENTTGRTLHTVRFRVRFLTAGGGKDIPGADVTFEPAMFQLPPRSAKTVKAHVRTAEVEKGLYVGLAESGRFRQVIALEVR